MPRGRGHVALAVSGSVAAHRALDVTSELVKSGTRVTVLMTAAAQEFLRPLFFQAMSRERVHSELFGAAGDDPYDHLGPARDAHVLAFVPASADLIGRLAHGLADDPPTTCALAFSGPQILAPAMNWRMWAHPAVQANVATLTDRGMVIVGPAAGDLACGEEGPGRLAAVSDILRAIRAHLPEAAPEARSGDLP